MYHPKRPSPTSYLLCGGICGIGVATVVARGFHNFTSFTIIEPFNTITYFVAALYAIVGPLLGAWLAAGSRRRENAALRAEIADLRAERDKLDTVLQAVKAADEQGEINGVRLTKALDLLKDLKGQQIADADTGPIPRLHSINGGGGA